MGRRSFVFLRKPSFYSVVITLTYVTKRDKIASARTQENFRACLIPETLNVSEPDLTRRLCQTVCRGAGGCQSQCFLDTKAQGDGVSKRSHGGITTADRRERLE